MTTLAAADPPLPRTPPQQRRDLADRALDDLLCAVRDAVMFRPGGKPGEADVVTVALAVPGERERLRRVLTRHLVAANADGWREGHDEARAIARDVARRIG